MSKISQKTMKLFKKKTVLERTYSNEKRPKTLVSTNILVNVMLHLK